VQGVVQYFTRLFQLPRRPSGRRGSGTAAALKEGLLVPPAEDTHGPAPLLFAPDVVCVQEAWEEEVIRALLHAAHVHGWHAARPATVKRLFFGEHTGLLAFSRHEILSHSTTIYSARSGCDWLANKGAQYLTICLASLGPPVTREAASVQAMQKRRKPLHVHLVNTHLNASPDVDVTASVSSSADVALQQLDQLLGFLPAAHLREGCVLVGDLNLLPAEVTRFLQKYQRTHGTRAVTRGGRLDSYVSFPEEQSQLDYCIAISGCPGGGGDGDGDGKIPPLAPPPTAAAGPASGSGDGAGGVGRGHWGRGCTALVGQAVFSDHLPIVTELSWVPT